MPAAVKSELEGSSCIPIILKCNAAVAAIVPTANVAEEIPVVVEPEVPAAKLAFANT